MTGDALTIVCWLMNLSVGVPVWIEEVHERVLDN